MEGLAPPSFLRPAETSAHPLALFQGAAIFREILRTGVNRGLERLSRVGIGGAAATRELEDADIELRLAALLRLLGGCKYRVDRLAPEIKLNHRVGPFAGLEPGRALVEFVARIALAGA